MRKRTATPISAFSLVEVTVAVGILAVAAIVIFGLLPTGIASVRSGNLEESATEILSAVAADLRRPEAPDEESPIFKFHPLESTPTAAVIYLDGNGGTLSARDKATFRLDATPHSNSNPRIIAWHLAISWPPQAATPTSSVENVVVLSRP